MLQTKFWISLSHEKNSLLTPARDGSAGLMLQSTAVNVPRGLLALLLQGF